MLFFENTQNFTYISKMQKNLEEMLMALEMTAFKVKLLISVSYDKNACERPSTC